MNVRGRIGWLLGGVLSALVIGASFVGWQLWSLRDWTPPKTWTIIGPVAITSRWSVALAERVSHPFLAEYDYRLEVFTSEVREGRHYGTVDLVPNSGGRTFLCVYRLSAPGQPVLVALADRMDTSIVDLEALDRMPRAPVGYQSRFVGAFVEEAAPLRFVPADLQPTCPADR